MLCVPLSPLSPFSEDVVPDEVELSVPLSDEVEDVSEVLEVSEAFDVSEVSEVSDVSLTELISEDPDAVLSFLGPYTLMILTAKARTKNKTTDAIVALLRRASFVLPAFFWKKLSEEVPEILCDICVFVSFIKTTTTINTHARIRTIALTISKIFIM